MPPRTNGTTIEFSGPPNAPACRTQYGNRIEASGTKTNRNSSIIRQFSELILTRVLNIRLDSLGTFEYQDANVPKCSRAILLAQSKVKVPEFFRITRKFAFPA